MKWFEVGRGHAAMVSAIIMLYGLLHLWQEQPAASPQLIRVTEPCMAAERGDLGQSRLTSSHVHPIDSAFPTSTYP